jgi:hypothetical protein
VRGSRERRRMDGLSEDWQQLFAVGSVDPDVDSFECDEAVSDHGVEGGEDGFDLVNGVDTFDDDGQVFREAEDVGRVETARLAEAFDPSEDGGPGETFPAERLNDRLVGGPSVVGVGLSDEDPEEACVGWLVHAVPFSVGEAISGRRDC